MMADYEYVEVRSPSPIMEGLARFGRRIKTLRKGKRVDDGSLTLPVGSRVLQVAATFPLQAYLQERFSHFGGKSQAARNLRAENQRRFDLAAARGNSRLSRTSGDWHPITPAEIAAINAAEEAAKLKMYPSDEPKNGPTPKRIESDLLRQRKIQNHREK